MAHEILGELQVDSKLKDSLIGSVAVADSTVPLRIQLDGHGREAVLDFAASIVGRIDHFVSLASRYAAAKLLDSYNEDWRFYNVPDGKGGFVEVTDPALSSEEFGEKLALSSVVICGETICEIWFSDGGMFAGHYVSVSSFDGAKFEDLDASLFG